MEHLEPVEETKQLATTVYTESLGSIQMALALTVALAWNAFVKKGISNFFNPGQNTMALFVYALIVTALFVVVITVMKRWLHAEVTSGRAIYAVTGGI